MPTKQRVRANEERRSTLAAQQPASRRQEHSVGLFQPRPGDLAAQNRQLMSEHHDLPSWAKRAPKESSSSRWRFRPLHRGEPIVVWGASDGPIHETAVVPYIVDVLNRLGYRARAHLVPSSFFAHAKPRVFRTMQVTYPGTADPTPYGFMNWFLCHATFNSHWFCDRHLDAAIQKANTVEATNIPAARVLWARIDRELVDRAASVPLVNPHWIDFVSRHLHNYEADPNLGLIADLVWLR